MQFYLASTKFTDITWTHKLYVTSFSLQAVILTCQHGFQRWSNTWNLVEFIINIRCSWHGGFEWRRRRRRRTTLQELQQPKVLQFLFFSVFLFDALYCQTWLLRLFPPLQEMHISHYAHLVKRSQILDILENLRIKKLTFSCPILITSCTAILIPADTPHKKCRPPLASESCSFS